MGKNLLIGLNLILLLSVVGLGGYIYFDKSKSVGPPPLEAAHNPEKALAKVGEKIIKSKNIQHRLKIEKAKDPSFNKSTDEMLEAMIKEELIYQDALAMKLPSQDKDLQEKIEENKFFTITNYYLINQIGSQIPMEEDKVKQFYHENSGPDKIYPPITKATVQVFSIKDAKKANKILEEIRVSDGKVNFLKILKSSSLVDSKFEEKDFKTYEVYPYKKFGPFNIEIANSVLNMSPKGISSPMYINGEYYFFKIKEKATNIPIPFDLYKDEITARYRDVQFSKMIDQKIEELKGKIPVEIL